MASRRIGWPRRRGLRTTISGETNLQQSNHLAMTQIQATVIPAIRTVELTSPAPLHEQKGFVDATATSLSISAKTVALVASGISRSMRVVRKEQPVHLTASLTVELEHCAKVYCGAVNTGDEVFEEATEFIISRFGHLGVHEVREAFRLAAAGELGDVDLRAYYGVFSILALGAVLQAYNEYRARIVKEIRRREILLLAAEREAEKSVSWNTAAWEAARREALLSMEDVAAECVTAYDYDWLSRSGELNPTQEEKEQAWAQAKELVLEDYRVLAAVPQNISWRKALDDVMEGRSNEGFYARRVATMKRLLVVGWIGRMREQVGNVQ